MIIKNRLILKIKRSGVPETVWNIVSLISQWLYSWFRIFLLQLRSYKIDFSVNIGKNTIFFQGIKHSIIVGRDTQIGEGCRIRSGFNGRIKIGKQVFIDDYTFIAAHRSIEIGDGSMIAAGCYLIDFNHKYPIRREDSEDSYVSSPIKIGSNVWLGAHTVVLPGVEIGRGSVVGAGSVVTKSIPPYALATGIPAVVKKSFSK